jgi:hypothetical protein
MPPLVKPSLAAVSGGSTPLTDARVVAVPATGAPIAAVPPRGSGTAFTLSGLSPGSWTIHVSAPGYAAAAVAQTIPASSALAVTLTPTTKPMPDLLGTTTTVALARLTSDAIQLDQILDVTGEEVPKAAVPSNRVSSRVLFQFPVPGEQVVAASARTRLVISAEAEAQITTVPSLVGLTYTQLVSALSAAGLKLGNITYLTK